MKPINEIAKKINIDEEYLIPFGKDKAKIDLSIKDKVKDIQDILNNKENNNGN